jgi:hypothetical protein
VSSILQYKAWLRLTNWRTDRELNIVLLAATSAKAAYGEVPTNPTSIQGLHATSGSVEQVTNAARDGSIKACFLSSHTIAAESAIVVAFRGTVSLVDWLVNLDGDLDEGNSFVTSNSQTHSDDGTTAETVVLAHAGLLRVAKAMAPIVCSKIIAAADSSPADTDSLVLLLTGHSAGGGVAGLITAHLRAQRSDILARFRAVHCVTFAAPPVLSPPMITPQTSPLSTGLSLNFVNFGDIVPRASKTYIRSLLNMYAARAEQMDDCEWDFGIPELWNYGSNVLLMDVSGIEKQEEVSMSGAEARQGENQEGDDDDEPEIRAFDISNDVWKRMAFGSVRTHPMSVYMEALEAVKDGFESN